MASNSWVTTSETGGPRNDKEHQRGCFSDSNDSTTAVIIQQEYISGLLVMYGMQDGRSLGTLGTARFCP